MFIPTTIQRYKNIQSHNKPSVVQLLGKDIAKLSYCMESGLNLKSYDWIGSDNSVI
jgi:hypothetical protein